MKTIKAVLWDFGGVITSSPFEAFNRYEAERNLPRDFIRGVNARNPDSNAWALLESDQISLEDFDQRFEAESRELGHAVRGADVLGLLAGDVRPQMVAALRKIRQRYKVACLTNNVRGAGKGPGMAADSGVAQQVADIMTLFDLVVESSKVGVRKPQPEFYELACEQLGIQPDQAVFMDDLGINLKPAKAMGMQTIKVVSPEQTLAELGALLGMELGEV